MNVVRTCVPDRVNASDVDLTEVDAVVVFKFLMSHGQFDQINRKAKLSKKPCVGLDRQSSKWGDVLRPIMTAVARREAASSPGLPVIAPANEPHEPRGPGRASADTIRSSLSLFKQLTEGEAEEGVILGALEPWRRFKSIAEVEEAIVRVVAVGRYLPADFVAWWATHTTPAVRPPPSSARPTLTIVPPLPPSEPMVTPEVTVESLLDQLKEAKELEAMYAREHEVNKQRITELEKVNEHAHVRLTEREKRINALDDACIKIGEENRNLKERNEGLTIFYSEAQKELAELRARPASSDKLAKIVASFKQLHESEVMSPDEIGKKLFELLILAK